MVTRGTPQQHHRGRRRSRARARAQLLDRIEYEAEDLAGKLAMLVFRLVAEVPGVDQEAALLVCDYHLRSALLAAARDGARSALTARMCR